MAYVSRAFLEAVEIYKTLLEAGAEWAYIRARREKNAPETEAAREKYELSEERRKTFFDAHQSEIQDMQGNYSRVIARACKEWVYARGYDLIMSERYREVWMLLETVAREKGRQSSETHRELAAKAEESLAQAAWHWEYAWKHARDSGAQIGEKEKALASVRRAIRKNIIDIHTLNLLLGLLFPDGREAGT